MGLPMAVNLRRKLGIEKKLVVYDVNQEALGQFAKLIDQEHDRGRFEIVSSPAEVICAAVSPLRLKRQSYI